MDQSLVALRRRSGFLAILLAAASMAACASETSSGGEIEQVDDALTGLERDLYNHPGDVDLCLDYASICEHAVGICLHVELASQVNRCTNIVDRCERNLNEYCTDVPYPPVPFPDAGHHPRDAGIDDDGGTDPYPYPYPQDGGPFFPPVGDAGVPNVGDGGVHPPRRDAGTPRRDGGSSFPHDSGAF